MHHRSTLAPFALLIILLASITLACGGTATPTAPAIPHPTTQPASTAAATTQPDTPTHTPTHTPTDTPIPPAAQYLGDTVESSGLALAALTLADPATPGLLYTQEAGTRLIAVELVIANTSDKTQRVNPLSASLVDAEGFVVTPELASVSNQIPTILLLPGQKVKGSIGFKIPENSVPSALKWAPDIFSPNSISISLEAPPAGHTAALGPIAAPPPAITNPFRQEAQAFGVGLTAVTLEDPATPGILHTPIAGTRLVAVEIIISNPGTASVSVNPLYFNLVDADGYLYDPELAGRDGQIDTTEIAPGEKSQGWVAFVIPESAQPVGIRYAPLFSEDILQVSVR
jgi:hypothetical protein